MSMSSDPRTCSSENYQLGPLSAPAHLRMAADTSRADSEELLSLAEAKGGSHIVGLQRRMGPGARYTRDLIKQGYVGKIRGFR
jgi:hypothetical protein